MKSLKCFALFVSLAALVLLAPRQLAQSPGSDQAKAVQLSATMSAQYDPNFEGIGAWVGYIWISFGNQPVKVASFIDRGTSYGERKNGNAYGTEVISVTFLDGSGTFEMPVRFVVYFGPTSGYFGVEEMGTVGNGTGAYARIAGTVTAHGHGVFGNPSLPGVLDPCVSTVTGSVTGL